MEAWNNIINAAMIGTDKKAISTTDLPDDLSEAANMISSNDAIDKEEKFLQLASLTFNYRQCGLLPLHKEQINISIAATEEKEYCSNHSAQVLKDIFTEDSIPLLGFWLKKCNERNKIALPELLPNLFSIGAQQKKLQTLIADCCGKRGEWLSGFNSAWNFSSTQTSEELWQRGTPEQRKKLLQEIRKINPAQAIEWLQQTWPHEDANTKTGFLEILSSSINESDILFLESLSSEKGKKVKDEAYDLLKHIPSSSIVLQYQQVLQQTVFLKKEKTLLGLSSKTSLQFHLPDNIDEAIYKSGIDKLSNTKDFSDEEFIIKQLIQSVPTSFWEKQLDCKPQDVINHFQKELTGKKMMPALILALKKFPNHEWAIAFMQHSEIFYIDIIPLLPLQQQDFYSNKFFEKFPDSIIQYAVQREAEWGVELASNILRYTAKNYYQYNRSFYNQHIHLIPAKIAMELEKFAPNEDNLRGSWGGMSDYILKLLQIKSQTIQSFNQ